VLASEGADGWANFVQHKILEERDYLTALLTQVVADLHRNILGEMRALLDQVLAQRIKGTHNPRDEYRIGDVVALDGASFIARKDNPGKCPGIDWQLLARQGQRGVAGPKGPPGKDAPIIQKWTPVFSDGRFGPALSLKELFAPSQADGETP
jgi:hypothetical protein